MNMKFKIIFLMVNLFFVQSFAQTPPAVVSVPSTSSKPAKKQTLNFEDELIEGNVSKPDLFYIFQKKNFNYKRLIKLRENFLPEMRKTTEDIQRVRGGH
jgi:hypothetical protein